MVIHRLYPGSIRIINIFILFGMSYYCFIIESITYINNKSLYIVAASYASCSFGLIFRISPEFIPTFAKSPLDCQLVLAYKKDTYFQVENFLKSP